MQKRASQVGKVEPLGGGVGQQLGWGQIEARMQGVAAAAAESCPGIPKLLEWALMLTEQGPSRSCSSLLLLLLSP